jgi:hypothetical protein
VLKQLVAELQEQIQVLARQIAEPEKQSKTPSFVKANRPKKELSTKSRKKRAAKHNEARRREEPARVERHAVEECTTCGYHLRAERDLLRRLVPVISPAADSALRTPNSALELTVHDPHPNRLPIPDDYSIEDANADFFD